MTAQAHHFTTGPAWLHRLVAEPSELMNWAWSLSGPGEDALVMRVLRGAHMRAIPALCDEMGAALQFPFYFGSNFNAIEDCLTDLDWLPGGSYVLVVTDAANVLAQGAPDDLEAYLALLARVHDYWQRGGNAVGSDDGAPVPFDVILHATPATAPRLAERLSLAHVAASELRIP